MADRKIYKYNLVVEPEQWVNVPINSLFLSIDVEPSGEVKGKGEVASESPSQVSLYVLVDPREEKEPTLVHLYSTGAEIPEEVDEEEFIDSFFYNGKKYHAFAASEFDEDEYEDDDDDESEWGKPPEDDEE